MRPTTRLPQNNRATAFTHVRGRGQVLLIEDEEHRGEHDLLVEDLRNRQPGSHRWSSKQLFAGLPELQRFDSVILANVAREHFSDEQIGLAGQQHPGPGVRPGDAGRPQQFRRRRLGQHRRRKGHAASTSR